MRTPAAGLAWCFGLRHRTGLSLIAVYLLSLPVLVHLPKTHMQPAVQFSLWAPLGFCLLGLMGIFAGADMDLVGTRSGFPNHLFTLPVSNRTLVFWPAALGTLGVGGFWLLFAAVVIVRDHGSGLLWWPACLLAAVTAALQALGWYPSPLPMLRGILIVVCLSVLSLAGALEWANGVTAEVLGCQFLAVIPISGLIAARGVALARSGEYREKAWIIGSAVRDSKAEQALPQRPFSSSFQAQVWQEWRRNGSHLSIFVGVMCVQLTVPLALNPNDVWVPLGISHIEIQRFAELWLLAIPMTALLGSLMGGGVRTIDTLRPDMTLQPFLATRPMSSLSLVGTKAAAAALSIAMSWVVLFVCAAAWLLLPARLGARNGTTGNLLFSNLSAHDAMVLLTVSLGLIILSWSGYVSSLWVTLSGRPWLMNAYPMGMSLVIFGGMAWLVVHLPGHPDLQASLLRLLPKAALLACVLKSLGAVAVITALVRKRLIRQRELAGAALVWLLAAAALFCLLLCQAPPALVSPGRIAVATFLALPLVRLGLAPLALFANRHR